MKKIIIISALAILASCSTTTSSTDLQKQDSTHYDSTVSKKTVTDSIK
jgi:uncharacterized lipoprotein YajG